MANMYERISGSVVKTKSVRDAMSREMENEQSWEMILLLG